MYFQLSALGKRMKEITMESTLRRDHDLSLGGTVVLDEGEDERHGGVTQDGEAHDHGNNLGVLHGVGDGDASLAGGDEGDETVEGTDEEAKQRTSWVVEGFSQRKKFFSSKLAQIGVQRRGHRRQEGDADGGEGGGRNVTEGEEHDTRDEDGGGEPLLPVVLLADDEDGESHHWNDLRGLEHMRGRS